MAGWEFGGAVQDRAAIAAGSRREPGHTVSRTTLVDRVWTDGAEFVEENALSVTVKRLRNKLEQDPSKPVYLKTVYGIGYTWAVQS